MDPEAFKEYLVDRYKDQIDWYERKASANKRMYQIFQWGVIILSAVVPVLIASAPQNSDTWKILTVIVSIVLAIGTASIKTFKFQETWVNYRATAERLIREKFLYDGNVGDYAETTNKESLFVERTESLLTDENREWLSVQKTNSGGTV